MPGAPSSFIVHRSSSKSWSGYLFALPYLLLFGTFVCLPLLYGLGLSFFRWELLSTLPPEFAGLSNYREALSAEYFHRSLGVTLRFVLLAVPLTVGLALAVALGLQAVRGPRQAFYRAAYYVPTVITVSVAGILWRWFYNSEFGLFNALLAPAGLKVPWITDPAWALPSLVLMTVWWTAGSPMVVLLAGLQSLPAHYFEAAALDGADAWQQFTRITLPLLRPVLLFVGVLNVIGAFQVFGQSFLITRGGPELSTRTLVHYIYDTAFNTYRMGYAAALSWLLFLVIAGFALLQFRLMHERE